MAAFTALLIELHVGVIDPRAFVDIRFIAPALGTLLNVIADLRYSQRDEPGITALRALQQHGLMLATYLFSGTDSMVTHLIAAGASVHDSHIDHLSVWWHAP